MSGDDIVSGLKAVGLGAGDVAFVHSSLSSFGHVEGGARTVVQALLDVLGSDGTLAVPIFRDYFTGGPGQVWDRDRSPSLMGQITEAARTWPGARRSPHAPHPIAAIGPLAEDLTERHNDSDFSFDSPFSRLLELNAWIVLIGIDYGPCTLMHLIEERAEIPYRHWVCREGTVVDGGVRARKAYPFLEKYPEVSNDFRPFGMRMEEMGLVRRTVIGESTVRAFRARDMYDRGMGAVRRDPLLLVGEDTKAAARRYLRKHGEAVDEQASSAPPVIPTSHPVSRRLADLLYVPRARGVPRAELRHRWETEDGLLLEELRLRGGPNDLVPCMLAVPRERRGPLPAVICLHGSSGTWEWTMEEPFLFRNSHLVGWARELARRGFVTLSVTQYGHPPRRESGEWANLLLPYGQTSMGRLVADVPFCVDYLQTRPEVDPNGIAAAGFSLGGINAFYSFAVDHRLAGAAVFCGGVGRVRRLIREGQTGFHSLYFYVHRLLAEDLDHPQLVRALAPRPLLIFGTTEDAGMPLAGVREFEEAASAAYRDRGAEDNFRVLVEEGPHAMTPTAFEAAVEWLGPKLSH